MFKCYDLSKIENCIFKCDQCKVPFDQYSQPKYLPCHETICSDCVVKIENEAINKKFKCAICLEDHYIPENGFALNKKVYDLITAEPMEISRGKEYDQLQENLKKLDSLNKSILFDCENGADIIKEYCMEQTRLVQLSTEKKIEQIQNLNDELIIKIKEYENKCVQTFSNKNVLIREKMNKIIDEAQLFIDEKQAYLQKSRTEEEDIKKFSKESIELQSALEEVNIKLKSVIFNDELIKFLTNTTDVNTFELGNITYERLSEPKTILSASSDGSIKQWDLETSECIKTYFFYPEAVLCIKKTSDNKIISGSEDGSINIVNMETSECLQIMHAHTNIVYNIELVSNERFVSCSFDGTIKLFDLKTLECLRTFIGHEDNVRCIEKLQNDSTIVSCSDDKTLRIWDLNSGECLKILIGHLDIVTCLKVFSDEKIISGSYQEIKIWNIESATCLQTIIGDSNWIFSITGISNEKIASCDGTGRIKIWNINTNNCLNTIEAHTGVIWRLEKLSINKIISCSRDNTIKVWDIDTGDCLKSLKDHTQSVNYIDIL